MVLAQGDLLVPHAMMAMGPLHGEVERLSVPGHGKAHCGGKTELKLRSEELLNVVLTIRHRYHHLSSRYAIECREGRYNSPKQNGNGLFLWIARGIAVESPAGASVT
jgi:hypothetical protein